MIVVDVGCHPHEREESVYRLIERFDPELLLGLDPFPELVEGVERHENTTIVRRKVAAWIHNEAVPYEYEGITSGVDPYKEALNWVSCVDIVALLRAFPQPLVLKLDCEGAEYPIVRRLVESGVDRYIYLVLVEWHPVETARGLYDMHMPKLRCPVEEW